MDKLPNCPKCNSEYTYEDGNLLVCPECAYEWTAGSEAAGEEQEVIKDANGNVLKSVDILGEDTGITAKEKIESVLKEKGFLADKF